MFFWGEVGIVNLLIQFSLIFDSANVASANTAETKAVVAEPQTAPLGIWQETNPSQLSAKETSQCFYENWHIA